jgi:hypothetical protein
MNRRFLTACLYSLSLFGCLSRANSQAIPAMERPIQLEGGAGFSFASPDYGGTSSAGTMILVPYIKGFTLFGDAVYHRRFGLEAEAHFDSILTPKDIGENTYMIGPKVSLIREGRMNLYVKALGGIGAFEYQKGVYAASHTDTYGAFAIGGGIEFNASRHITVRAIDIEQQSWPGFAPNGLKPFVTTLGIAYRE